MNIQRLIVACIATSDLSFLAGPNCVSVLSVSPGGSGRASLSRDIAPQWLESGAGFGSTILSMLD